MWANGELRAQTVTLNLFSIFLRSEPKVVRRHFGNDEDKRVDGQSKLKGGWMDGQVGGKIIE